MSDLSFLVDVVVAGFSKMIDIGPDPMAMMGVGLSTSKYSFLRY